MTMFINEWILIIYMIEKKLLIKLVENFQKELKTLNTVKRNLSPIIIPKFATIISGIRRCGKSVLSKQLVKNYQKIYYFHFENVQLSDFEQKDFSKLDECFLETIGEEGIYLLDEIQNIKGWEIYVRQLVDNGNKVIITGSNASMLSKELGTRLTGRHLSYELYPFSYNEYLSFTKKRKNIDSFENYFQSGGFPEYLNLNINEVLENLFQDVFYRDIVVRNDIKKEIELKKFITYISANVGVEISYNKIQKLLGLGSHNTVSQFILACEQAYLFFSINKFDYSIKKQSINPKKLYCVDNGLLRLNSFSFSDNLGRYLENLVFMGLKRKYKEIYYYKNNNECDFIVNHKGKIIMAIQVCYKLNDMNKDREFAGLIEALKEFNLENGTIVTYNQEDEFVIDERKIKLIPAYKWLN